MSKLHTVIIGLDHWYLTGTFGMGIGLQSSTETLVNNNVKTKSNVQGNSIVIIFFLQHEASGWLVYTRLRRGSINQEQN